jgi:crotonobetainyl-CoA:carnitine CoA-transferase CaiB-like acyl-CoA transferase
VATGGAFEGVKIVEYATMVSGPYCGKLFADMGADVVKIEEPPLGDSARQRGPFPGDVPHPEKSALFLYLNTNKRSIALDVNKPDGRGTFRRLIRWADVLIDNHVPGGLESLGFGWDELQKENAGLIFASMTPYGRTGPRAKVKGGELTSFHAGGLGNLLPTRSENLERAPVKAGGYPTGYTTGLTAATAIAGALYGKRANGDGGRFIDVSEQEAILGLVRTNVASAIYDHTTWSRVPDRPPALGRLQCSDGYVVALLMENHHWRGLVELMGNPEWASGPEWDTMYYRAGHLMEIAPQIAEWAIQQKKEYVHHEGAAKGFAIGSVYSAEEVMNWRQHAARNYFVEVEHPEAGKARYAGWPYKMPASPPKVRRPAPLLGQHSREVLQDVLGLSSQEVARLCREKVVWETREQ